MISPTQLYRKTQQELDMIGYMKKTFGAVALLAAVATSTNSLAQEYSPFNRLGTNEAICVGGIQTPEESLEEE